MPVRRGSLHGDAAPAVAAASVVFDHAVDESVLREALDEFLGVARVAGHHRLTEVMDHLWPRCANSPRPRTW